MSVFVCEACGVLYRPPWEEIDPRKGIWGYRKECPVCGTVNRERLEVAVEL